jgi:DNA-binding ferritin-like protein
MKFWAPEAEQFLKNCGRQDLVDKGDDFAERSSALIMTAIARLDKYAKEGDLYNAQGGKSILSEPDALAHLDDFVNRQLRNQVNVLEKLLETFADLRAPEPLRPVRAVPSRNNELPTWY